MGDDVMVLEQLAYKLQYSNLIDMNEYPERTCMLGLRSKTGLSEESDETVRNADPELRVDIKWMGYRLLVGQVASILFIEIQLILVEITNGMKSNQMRWKLVYIIHIKANNNEKSDVSLAVHHHELPTSLSEFLIIHPQCRS